MGTIIAGKKAKKQKLQKAAKESKSSNKDASENPSEDISNGSENKDVSEKESDTSCADISMTGMALVLVFLKSCQILVLI